MEQEPLKTMPIDHDEHLFTIEIKVFRNAQQMTVQRYNENAATWQAIIGAMDIQKTSFYLTQSTRKHAIVD